MENRKEETLYDLICQAEALGLFCDEYEARVAIEAAANLTGFQTTISYTENIDEEDLYRQTCKAYLKAMLAIIRRKEEWKELQEKDIRFNQQFYINFIHDYNHYANILTEITGIDFGGGLI